MSFQPDDQRIKTITREVVAHIMLRVEEEFGPNDDGIAAAVAISGHVQRGMNMALEHTITRFAQEESV